jgi:hypothetical protein
MAAATGFVQAGGNVLGGVFDNASAVTDAKNSKSQGYLVADANETRVRASSNQALGEQRAAAVESGFNANTGSLAAIQTQSAGNLELDALNQRYKGQINAWQQDATIARIADKESFLENPMSGTKFGRFASKFNNGGLGSYTKNSGMQGIYGG